MTALVCFTMDNLGDAADLYRGVIQQPRKPGERPAFEIGYPALLALYKQFEIPITHFVEGWSAEQYPEEIERVLSHGHQVGMHGWQHEKWNTLAESEAKELIEKATQAIHKAGGVSPTAFRAPGGGTSMFTAPLLLSHGYKIDASIAPSGQDGGPVGCVLGDLWKTPYTWAGVDASHWLWQKRTASETEAVWKQALNDAADANSHMIFIWHPHVMGIDKGRMSVGENIAEYVRQEDSRFKVATLSELVSYYKG